MLDHRAVIAAIGRDDFSLVNGTHVVFDGSAKEVDPTGMREWDQSAYNAVANAPAPKVLPRWAVEGVISDLPGRNPDEPTLLDTFRAAIDGIEDATTRRIFKGKLAAVDEWHRDSPIVEQVRQLLGMTPGEIDAFWAQGEALVAAAEQMGV